MTHFGIIEVKKVATTKSDTPKDHLFLLDVDKYSKKIHAVYGPFTNTNSITEFAAMHGLPLEVSYAKDYH